MVLYLLSGFGDRHAMLVDQETEKVVVPLNGLSEKKKIELANSKWSYRLHLDPIIEYRTSSQAL